jgi:citrate synthase
MANDVQHGLEGVLVAESELSDIDGTNGRLVYRGYPIRQLARETTFEEVLYLLWYGRLPDRDERDESVVETLRGLAADGEDPIAALRTDVSEFAGESLGETDVAASDCVVLAIQRDGDLLTDLFSTFELREGDRMILVGSDAEISHLAG